MKLTRFFVLIMLAAVFLAACNNTPAETVQIPVDDGAETAVQETNLPSTQPDQTAWPDGQTQQDDQGQVEVAVTPLNLSHHDQTLDFDVAMNTHSVELSMDLAALSELSTDTGLTVNAATWTAPGGGHHATGALSFPAVVDGVHILDDASRLILTIRDVDAPERAFTWSLSE
jgi:hypothetical protein